MEDVVEHKTPAKVVAGTKFFEAFAKFQASAPAIEKTARNPHFNSAYAPLDEVVEKVRPVLAEAGLVVVQFTDDYSGTAILNTILVHAESGEGIESIMALRPSKNDAQGVGSALTYARRYSLVTILGLVTEDDEDGNAASAPPARKSGGRRQSSAKPKAEKPTDEQKARLAAAMTAGSEVDSDRFSTDAIEKLAQAIGKKPLADLDGEAFERVVAKVEKALAAAKGDE